MYISFRARLMVAPVYYLFFLNHQLGKMIHVSVAILNLQLAGRKHFSRVLEIK